MWKKLLLMATVPVVALIYVSAQSSSPVDDSFVAVPSPTEWVAFQADLRITEPDARSRVGRFYRSRDGSTRLETGPDDSDARVFSIKNIAESAHYTGNTKGKWLRRPMVLPIDGWQPPQIKAGPRLVRLPEPIEGFEVYRLQNDGDGRAFYFAPALNLFPIVEQASMTGLRKVFWNIQLVDPPAHLFGPPAGANVERSDTPFGIVAEPPHLPAAVLKK